MRGIRTGFRYHITTADSTGSHVGASMVLQGLRELREEDERLTVEAIKKLSEQHEQLLLGKAAKGGAGGALGWDGRCPNLLKRVVFV
jgi:hypothetical protein